MPYQRTCRRRLGVLRRRRWVCAALLLIPSSRGWKLCCQEGEELRVGPGGCLVCLGLLAVDVVSLLWGVFIECVYGLHIFRRGAMFGCSVVCLFSTLLPQDDDYRDIYRPKPTTPQDSCMYEHVFLCVFFLGFET
jgi:hypothetical protein